MTGETLRVWMEAARMSAQDMAEALVANGSAITRQRIYQWCRGESISEYWQARIEQVMAQVDMMDHARIGARMGQAAPGPDGAATPEQREEAVA